MGCFLLWIGWGLVSGAWRGQLSLQAATAAEVPLIGRMGLVPAGVALSISNPYWSLWWASVGAGMILTALQWGTFGLVMFYAVHWLTDFVWLSAMSFLTASGRGLMDDRVYRIVLGGCGLFLVAFSVYFVSSGLDLISQIH